VSTIFALYTTDVALQETFARRLQQFYASTSPLLTYYSAQPDSVQTLLTTRGNTSDEIWPQLETAVLEMCPNLSLRPQAAREEKLKEKREAALTDVVAEEANVRTSPHRARL
jgi:nucleoside-triphosphate--adenylate kinase